MDINVVVIAGRVVNDIEVKTSNGGFHYGTVTIASNYSQKGQSGFETKSNFIDVKVLGDRAKALESWLKKGRQIIVRGQLRQDRWTDAQGQNKSKIGIIADDVQVAFDNQNKNGSVEKKEVMPHDDVPFF